MKKTIKLLLTAAICAMLTVVLAAVSFAARELGDVNGDGKVDVSDARLVLRFAVNLQTPENDEVKTAADVDGSGSITVADARLVLRAAVGLQTLECLHTFEWRQVDAVAGYSAWSNGTHIKTCTKCGATTGVAVDCTLGTEFTYVDRNGNDTDQGPTCTKSANYYQTCSVCGGKKEGTFKQLPHKYNKGNTELVKVTKEATCTEAGELEVKCESCKIYTKKFSIPALGHNIVDKDLAEGETVHCDRCNKDIAPADFDYNDNEYNIYKSGKFYYKGNVKEFNGYDADKKPKYETSEVTLAINPGQSVYMKMSLNDSTEIGYLAYKEKNLLGKTETKKYFETFSESENKRYYFYLEDYIVEMMAGDDKDEMKFPGPDDNDLKAVTSFELNDSGTEKASVVKEGKVCTRFTYEENGGTTCVYMDGKKLLLIETLKKDVVTSAIYFDFISADIPTYMTTTEKQGTVLRGMTGLMRFAIYSGLSG